MDMVKKSIAKKSPAKKAAKKKAPKKKSPKNKSSVGRMIAASKRRLVNARERAIKEGESLFKQAVKEIFKDFKSLESFSWDQYTPHWNDGDECLFGVHLDSLRINGEEHPECIYTLESLDRLLSDKNSEARIIMELADTKKDRWEVESLKRDLESIRTRDPKKVAETYEIKKAIHDLLSEIDETVYQNMFGEGAIVATRDGVAVEECEHD